MVITLYCMYIHVLMSGYWQIWRGFSQRKKIAVLREEELEFIGMVEPRAPASSAALKKTPGAHAKKTEVEQHDYL